MSFDLNNTLALLERTPASLNALLRDLPESWTQTTEGDGTWTVYGVIGHLIHGERTDWIPRMQRILEHGEAKAFDPFDREAQNRESVGKTLPQLLDEFAEIRVENVRKLRALNLQEADVEKKGTHLRLGTVTLGNLLATWAAHDLTHLHQISRIMAHQLREEVGPWSVFLGVLKCNGHSS